MLLKGPVDVACTADGPLYAQSGPAWRATAGAGDVLAGLLGAVLAQGVAPLPAAALAAFVHGRACPRRPVRAGGHDLFFLFSFLFSFLLYFVFFIL